MRALILANGDPPSSHLLSEQVRLHDLFIATDGAAHKAAALGQVPDIVNGDFDSADLDIAMKTFSNTQFISTPDQTRTDTDKAITIARNLGASSITLTGAGGGRIDHTLGNLSILLQYHRLLSIAIVSDEWELRVISGSDDSPGEWIVSTCPGDKVGLVCFGESARGTILGVSPPLINQIVEVGAKQTAYEVLGNQVTFQSRGAALFACLHKVSNKSVGVKEFTTTTAWPLRCRQSRIRLNPHRFRKSRF